jgi:hypothetical protein
MASDLYTIATAKAAVAPAPDAAATVELPREAVVTRRLQRFVLVARGPDRFEPVPVQIIHEAEGRAVISGPVAVGDRVIASGAVYLFNMLVLAGAI